MKISAKALMCAIALSVVSFAATPAHAEYISYRNHDSGVEAAQMRLKNLGYYAGKVDGINGPRTSTAFANFQRDNGLMVTGNYDYYTQAMLFPVYNTAYNNAYVRSYGYVQQGYVVPIAYAVPLNEYRAGATYAQPVAYAAQLPVARPIATTYAIPESVRYGNYHTPMGSPITTVVPRPW